MIIINPSSKDTLKLFQPFLPRYIPFGIGYLLAAMDKEGFPAYFFDEQVEDNILARVAECVKKFEEPYIFGFGVLTASFKRSIMMSKRLKEIYPDSTIIFGGIHPTALPDESLAYDHIDFVLGREADKTLPELYRCLKNKTDYTHIDNLSYKKDGKICHTQRVFPTDSLENYPPFPYHLFSPHLYDFGLMMTSRGCPYDCAFCSNRLITGKKFRYRPPGAVLDELDMLHKKYQIRNVTFLDDIFLFNKERTYLILDGIKELGLDKQINFDCQTRADTVDDQILRDLYNAGFKTIAFGLETASEKIMRTINKGETVAESIAAVRMAKKIGFKVRATFIYALPGETHQDRMDCIRMDRDLGLNIIRYNNATPYPGTKLYEIAKSENRLHVQGLWENFNSVLTLVENPFKRIPFAYVPPGNTENEIRRDLLFAYFASYINFGRILENMSGQDLRPGLVHAHENFATRFKKAIVYLILALMFIVKFVQLFYYCVVKKETRISWKFFISVFTGLWKRRTKSLIQN